MLWNLKCLNANLTVEGKTLSYKVRSRWDILRGDGLCSRGRCFIFWQRGFIGILYCIVWQTGDDGKWRKRRLLSLRLLLEHHANPNSHCAPSGKFAWACMTSCIYVALSKFTFWSFVRSLLLLPLVVSFSGLCDCGWWWVMVVAVGAATFGASHGSICWSLLVKSRNSENLEWNQKKYSKLPKGSVVWFEASIVGLDATSQASKHFACLSGGTPLALAAFVGDEVPKIRESRWCSWHRFYMALLCFIAFGCFWRLP